MGSSAPRLRKVVFARPVAAHAVNEQIVYVLVTIVVGGATVVVRRPVLRPVLAPVNPGACGIPSPAFCATFDKPSTRQGCAGEIDPARWSGARMQPLLPVGRVPIAVAKLPPCCADLPTMLLSDRDTVICRPTATTRSNHLLVAAAAQNYGQNSYRVRQPFDFAGRTGAHRSRCRGRCAQWPDWPCVDRCRRASITGAGPHRQRCRH